MHKELWSSAPLPYPQIVTLFLRHFQIPLDNEPFVQVKHSFAIGVGAVTSFGYRKDMDGQWVKKDAHQQAQDERTPSPPPQRVDTTSLLQEVLTELRDFRATMSDRIDNLDTSLKEDMSFIRRCFDPPTDS